MFCYRGNSFDNEAIFCILILRQQLWHWGCIMHFDTEEAVLILTLYSAFYTEVIFCILIPTLYVAFWYWGRVAIWYRGYIFAFCTGKWTSILNSQIDDQNSDILFPYSIHMINRFTFSLVICNMTWLVMWQDYESDNSYCTYKIYKILSHCHDEVQFKYLRTSPHRNC